MNKLKLVIFLVFILSACARSNLKVTEIDPRTGHLPSEKKASVIINEKVDLDSMKSLILVSDDIFLEKQIIKMKYFDKVMNYDDLQREIVHDKLQEKIPSLADKLGINRAYLNYRPFLWFRFQERSDGTNRYAQFILTDPKDLRDIFIAEKRYDLFWGVNDQTTWYPLFNAFIDYVRDNSKTYRSN